jgi:hypothetical protein
MRISTLYLVLLVAAVPALAQEHVIRLASRNNPSQNCVATMYQQYANGFTGTILPACDVAVWSASDVQGIIATAQETTKAATQQKLDKLQHDLNEEMTALRKDIQRLSDCNDALTKRLNELETKQNKATRTGTGGPSKPPSIAASGRIHLDSKNTKESSARTHKI